MMISTAQSDLAARMEISLSAGRVDSLLERADQLGHRHFFAGAAAAPFWSAAALCACIRAGFWHGADARVFDFIDQRDTAGQIGAEFEFTQCDDDRAGQDREEHEADFPAVVGHPDLLGDVVAEQDREHEEGDDQHTQHPGRNAACGGWIGGCRVPRLRLWLRPTLQRRLRHPLHLWRRRTLLRPSSQLPLRPWSLSASVRSASVAVEASLAEPFAASTAGVLAAGLSATACPFAAARGIATNKAPTTA